jgi:hypothetical protein
MPGLGLDESPHAIRRRFSESSDLPLMQRLVKLYRESMPSAPLRSDALIVRLTAIDILEKVKRARKTLVNVQSV